MNGTGSSHGLQYTQAGIGATGMDNPYAVEFGHELDPYPLVRSRLWRGRRTCRWPTTTYLLTSYRRAGGPATLDAPQTWIRHATTAAQPDREPPSPPGRPAPPGGANGLFGCAFAQTGYNAGPRRREGRPSTPGSTALTAGVGQVN